MRTLHPKPSVLPRFSAPPTAGSSGYWVGSDKLQDPIRILIVEDEPLIAMLLEDFIEDMGSEVAGVADSVGVALDLIGRGGIAAAIVDVNLKDGERSDAVALELAAQGIPFVVSSGSAEGTDRGAFEGRPCVGKPFTMDVVRVALEAIL